LKLSILVKTNIQYKGERNRFQKPKSLSTCLLKAEIRKSES